LTSTETRWRRLIIRWTGRKGFFTIIIFLAISVIVEILLVYSFITFGLVDRNILTANLIIPYAKWSFTLSVSPLLHLLPLSVIVVLLTNWTYLTKFTAFVPQRVETARRPPPSARRAPESRRFKSIRRFLRSIDRRLQRVGRASKSTLQRIPGVSYISQRLTFASAVVRDATAVLAVFICMVLMLYLVEYPDLIRNLTVNLYRDAPALRGLVVGIAEWLRGVGNAAPPLGRLGSSIINALIRAGPGFRHSLTSAGASLTGPIAHLNVFSKYALTQNVAAWTSAIMALVYGAYASSRPRRRPRRR
jgi:hypothetical protein